jgi:hypothetical protein
MGKMYSWRNLLGSIHLEKIGSRWIVHRHVVTTVVGCSWLWIVHRHVVTTVVGCSWLWIVSSGGLWD